MFKYIFFLNLEVIQLKLLKDLAHTYFVTDKRKTKNKCKKNFHLIFLLTAAPVAVM
jgi:hypothetical protein